MKRSTKNRVAGKIHEAKGKVKEMTGELTDNPELEAEGESEKIAGKVQQKIGKLEKTIHK